MWKKFKLIPLCNVPVNSLILEGPGNVLSKQRGVGTANKLNSKTEKFEIQNVNRKLACVGSNNYEGDIFLWISLFNC